MITINKIANVDVIANELNASASDSIQRVQFTDLNRAKFMIMNFENRWFDMSKCEMFPEINSKPTFKWRNQLVDVCEIAFALGKANDLRKAVRSSNTNSHFFSNLII